MTWSIVAYDEQTGAFGAAVATKAFAAGTFVPFVRSGVGAVGTQSLTNRYLAPAVLNALERGLTPQLAIASALAGDEGREIRQLHCVDRHGRHAAWSGRHCVEWAGSVGEPFVSVAGNMLSNDQVAAATLAGFNADPAAPLPERLLAALEGGEVAGGDRRGRQSASIVMTTTEDFPDLSIRVDDSSEPLPELRRLLHIWRTERAPYLGNSPSKANPSGVHDIDVIEAGWIARGWDIRFKR
ncbi:MAG TPA: DUF1028 domain-containing protein [Caulobacteraceae bacterium]|jgi:uncharacterized Ntn-hydrolase superfamily protein|nr:DUF1028 domain-containing protein [Caulobacteraceae bacterium]